MSGYEKMYHDLRETTREHDLEETTRILLQVMAGVLIMHGHETDYFQKAEEVIYRVYDQKVADVIESIVGWVPTP